MTAERCHESVTDVIAWLVDSLAERGWDPDVSASGTTLTVHLDGTTPTAPAPHVEDMPEWDALVERWKASLAGARLGWIVDDEGKSWPPHGSHRGTCGHPHIYDGGCAICRAGDQAEALDALLRFLAADLIAWEATR